MPTISYVHKIFDPLDLAYMAGIVDGEGCFCIGKMGPRYYHRCKSPKYQSQLRICNTKVELMEWIESRFPNISNTLKRGRRFMQKENKIYDRIIYEWIVSGHRLLDISRQILPYLVIKKQQCENIIRFRETFSEKNHYGSTVFIEPEKLQVREECYLLNRSLNAKTTFQSVKHISN